MTGQLFDDHAELPGTERTDPAEPGRERATMRPLADRMRPQSMDDVLGQDELLGPDGPLRRLLRSSAIPSLLLWGPPGCGKTTLARLLAFHGSYRFLEYSAVAVGSKELKTVMTEAGKLLRAGGTPTVLFLDEIHRFNKAQQDALLPFVERGDITLIGATTENPSFEVNSALLSRTSLFVLAPLAPDHVRVLLDRALAAPEGLADCVVPFTEDALDTLSTLSQGDARIALNMLESIVTAVTAQPAPDDRYAPVNAADALALIQRRAARYDRTEEHYNIISALHKSLRNSDVNAALYYLGRMLEAGEDLLYVARRLVRFASEDVGLADPQALPQALAARDAAHFIGLPEAKLALAQATVYLALAPKSNALYTGYGAVAEEVASGVNPPVPLHIRNAPTRLMKDIGYGRDYVYAHDTATGIAAMTCLPDGLGERIFYKPGGKGFEKELGERLEKITAWRRRQAQKNRTNPGGRE